MMLETEKELTLQIGHFLTGWAHVAHMAVCPHGWKEISHGPSQRKQLGPVTDSTSLSSVLLESPPDTETSGGVASLLLGVVTLWASPILSAALDDFVSALFKRLQHGLSQQLPYCFGQ